MNKAEWTTEKKILDDVPDARRDVFKVNGVEVGWVIYYTPEGPFYPHTQVRRFGAVGTLLRARILVENNAVPDVLFYATVGAA